MSPKRRTEILENILSDDERDELRLSLETSKRELEALLELASESEKPVAVDSSIGRLTRMDALQQQSMAQATSVKSVERIRQMVAALDRMAKGTYGNCLACKEPIPIARLRVRAEATLCVECQTDREKRS